MALHIPATLNAQILGRTDYGDSREAGAHMARHAPAEPMQAMALHGALHAHAQGGGHGDDMARAGSQQQVATYSPHPSQGCGSVNDTRSEVPHQLHTHIGAGHGACRHGAHAHGGWRMVHGVRHGRWWCMV